MLLNSDGHYLTKNVATKFNLNVLVTQTVYYFFIN